MKNRKETKEKVAGFISVRGFPSLGKSSQDELLKRLEDEYEICSDCQGYCESYGDRPKYIEGVTSFKIHSSKILTTLKENGTLSSERVKAIVELLTVGRSTCATCQGLGIVAKQIKEENNVTKKRNRKS